MNITKINQDKNINNKNFGAIRVATAGNCYKNRVTKIDICEVTQEDWNILKYFKENINFKKILPNMNEDKLERWQEIFNYCIEGIFEPNNKSYIAITDKNQLCGILTYFKEGSTYIADGLCSIPDNKGKKVNYLGKTLLYHLFRLAHDDNARAIRLEAVTDGPFDVIHKYETLGFKKQQDIIVDHTKIYVPMICNKHRISEQLKELPFNILYKETPKEIIDLNIII